MGAASEKWIAPEHRVRHRHVPAVRISSMPWMDAEHAGTPRTAVLQQRERLVSTPAVRRPTAPWLECAGTPRVRHHHLLSSSSTLHVEVLHTFEEVQVWEQATCSVSGLLPWPWPTGTFKVM